MGFRQRAMVLTAVAIAAWLVFVFPASRSTGSVEEGSRSIQQALQECRKLTQEVEALSARLEPGLREPVFSEWRFSDMLEREKPIPQTSVLVLEDERPVFWNNGEVLPEQSVINTMRSGSCILMANGWYYLVRRDAGDRTLLVLTRIYTGYALQNQLLRNGFHPLIGLESTWRPAPVSTSPGSTRLLDHRGELVLDILPDPAGSTSPTGNPDLWFVVLLAALLILLLDVVSHWGIFKGGLLVVTAWAFRLWTDLHGWPSSIARIELFNPVHYASGTLLNSLGDLLITSSIILLSIVFLHKVGGKVAQKGSLKHFLRIAPLLVGATTVLSITVDGLFSGLVLNSQIAFDIRDFFALNAYTVGGLCAVVLLLIALYLAADATSEFLMPLFSKGMLLFLTILVLPQAAMIVVLTASPGLFTASTISVTALLMLQALFVSALIRRKRGVPFFAFSAGVPVLLLFAVYSAQSLYELNANRERNKRMLFAQKLDSEKDRIAEFLLENLTDDISIDTLLGRFLFNPPTGLDRLTEELNATGAHLQRNYLGGYLSRYEASFRYFDRNEKPINLSGDPSWNLDDLRLRVPTGIQPAVFRNDEGKTGYSMLIPITYRNQPAGTLSLVLMHRAGGLDDRRLPSLLLSDQLGTETGKRGYAYALYKQGKLVSQQGEFNYYQTDAPYRIPKDGLGEMAFASGDGIQHLFYRQADRLVIVSVPDYGWTGWVTLFSYLFTFFGILFLTAMSMRHIALHGFRFAPSLRNRLQAGVLGMVTFTLLLLGAATIAFFVRNYRDMQVKRLYEQLDELQNLTEEIAGNLDQLQGDAEENIRFALERVASSTRADFNVFGRDGFLFYTSQPGIYQQGLQAPLMDRKALRALTVGQQTVFDQGEHIGKLDYISAYEPLRNSQNTIIGYLNIPFYDRETELKEYISDFLVALINLYVFLFSLALLIAFIISGRMTAPLQLLQENLRETRLGRLKPLEWRSRDEFGELIDTYNSMLDQLQRSAEMLARSEREGAWKEMARQVAHEIKNPLTPMKLGIQHLQRILQDDKSPDRVERTNRICNTLVEQIDTLAGIAGAFSDFARMPGPEMGTLDLIPVLENTVSLYGNDPRARIVIGPHAAICPVAGDKDQLLRIFGNLVKNGLQAIPEDRAGEIKITIIEEPGYLTVGITDNGTGIPAEQQKRLFSPNFTTKSGGTGLGLVMVKAMTEGMGGEVRFETEEGKGTTFFIRLPRPLAVQQTDQDFS